MALFPSNIEASVRNAIERYPEKAQSHALTLRTLIYDVAQSNEAIGTIEETLKWCEPAYLTRRPKSGTTIRFDWKEKSPDKIGLFVSCQTTLISDFQMLFPSELSYDGNRAIWLDLHKPLAEDILKLFIGKALTYHLEPSS